MKALLFAQLNPVKTLDQTVHDRGLVRILIITALLLAVCG